MMGGASGIGRSVALALAGEGANVALNFRSNPDDAAQVAGEICALGRQALLLPGDLADYDAVETMISSTVATFGRLDHLVVTVDLPVEGHSEAPDKAGAIGSAVQQLYNATRATARQMIQQNNGGSIAIVTSTDLSRTAGSTATENFTKATIQHLMRTAAAELAKHRIRVNMVAPDAGDSSGLSRCFTDDPRGVERDTGPVQRTANADGLTKAVTYSLSPTSSSVTGRVLTADGDTVRILNAEKAPLISVESRVPEKPIPKSGGSKIARFATIAALMLLVAVPLGVYGAFQWAAAAVDRETYHRLMDLNREVTEARGLDSGGPNWKDRARQLQMSVAQLERRVKGGHTGTARRDVSRMARALKEMIETVDTPLLPDAVPDNVSDYDRAAKAFKDYSRSASRRLGL